MSWPRNRLMAVANELSFLLRMFCFYRQIFIDKAICPAAGLANGILRLAAAVLWLAIAAHPVFAQDPFEGRPVGAVNIELEAGDVQSTAAAEQYRLIARTAVGDRYSTVRVRDAIAVLYDTRQIATVAVQASDAANDRVDLRFIIRRRTVAKTVSVRIEQDPEQKVTEQELLLRLNLLDPGKTISERTLQNNADAIVEYLRDRGFYRAEAQFEQRPIGQGIDVAVVFRVNTGQQAKLENLDVNIDGIETAKLTRGLRLTRSSPFSRSLLDQDIERIRESLRAEGFLAPSIDEPRLVYDSETNSMDVRITGNAGPSVTVLVESDRERVGSGTQNRLLPVKRGGTLDYAAIVEGERRLENHYQEQGYFFVNVVAVCSVEPPLAESGSTTIANGTEYLCSALNGSELSGREVEVKYVVDLDRRLRLVDIRLRGTNLITIDDITGILDSREANILGIVPLFGYGRGYTSQRILESDAAAIRSLLRELGYREAEVRVNQGVSLSGDDLIITFVVEEGPRTAIAGVAINGNTAFSDDVLLAKLPDLVGRNFSFAKVRNGQRRLSEFYSENGYFDAVVNFSVDQGSPDPATGEGQFRIVYNIQSEGGPVNVNKVLVTGNDRTGEAAILRAVTLRPGELLKAGDIYSSEQNLYGTDAFQFVQIRTQPAGDRPEGGRSADVIIEVQEQKPRLFQWGGGFSTDLGWSGFADIRHFNLLGNLWQGGSRVRWSQRQQIVQFDFINPRFLRDGRNRFAPLALSAQYQRDSTVTRFFRSAFDRGTFGIVQRVDKNGDPIDEFGAPAGDPTLNRLTFTAETNRTLSLKDRSILFLKYRFESVRLANIRSLLIRDLLIPDDKVRISGFGATIVRDTRRRCGIRYSILDIIARGEPGEPCRYNASDPTNGDYLTAEYNVSVPGLGANVGFHKFQASYNYYYTFPGLKNTTIAARGILGLASVFKGRQDLVSPLVPGLEGVLPISERFFAGGANTLRGFEFEAAGPRVLIIPTGEFRDSNGNQVFLDPFTVPFGGNAIAVLNIEARVPVSNTVRFVPFYDGGNVFLKSSDLFNPRDIPFNDAVARNLRAVWSHTVGLGLRIKTPIGGEFGIDYGYLLNPPSFEIPQGNNPPAFYRLRQGQLHFRFSQAF